MQREAPPVRVERRERRPAAHVRDPGPGRDRGRDLGDRAVGDAEEDEVRARSVRIDSALAKACAHGAADAATRTDDVDVLDHAVAPVPRGYRARRSIAPAARISPGRRAVSPTLDRRPLVVRDRVPGAVAVLAAAHEHVLAVDALERRAHRLHRAARALVARVGLELDTAASPGLEGVAEHQELRLDVDARAPGGRVEPRPADLDRRVLRPQREEPRRADDPLGADRHERDLGPGRGRPEGVLDPGVELGSGRRLRDREPPPGSRVARRLPEPVGVAPPQRLEPDETALERRRRPPGHVSRLRACRSTSTRAWSARSTSTSSSAPRGRS